MFTRNRKNLPEIYFDLDYEKQATLFKLFLMMIFLGVTSAFLLSYFTFFVGGSMPISYLEHIWTSGHFLWAAGIPACFLGLTGLLLFNKKSLYAVKNVKNTVSFRVVSYGKNVEALRNTIDHIVKIMEKTPAFPYIVEILVEEGQPFCDIELLYSNDQVRVYVVPKSYETPNKTIKKARALQYAMENSWITSDTWIVHLDEESRPSKSMILGIARAIYEEEKSGDHRIGQGTIVYYRHWLQKRFWWWTLFDSGRTGQDIGPFFLQSQLGTSLYGFHGSWILIRNSVEKSIPSGFDLGIKGSITEDAWWCLVANANGHKIRWVEGYLEEQSVRSFRDFCKQRGRWFYGLRLVSKYAPVSFWRRLPLGLNLVLWMLVWVSIPYSILHVFFGFVAHPLLITLISLSFASYVSMIVAGMWINMKLAGIRNPFVYISMTFIQIILVPIYALMEMYAAFIYGVCFPDKDDFHVIEK